MKSFIYLSVLVVLIFTLSISTGLINAQTPEEMMQQYMGGMKQISGKYANSKWGIEFVLPEGYTGMEIPSPKMLMVSISPDYSSETQQYGTPTTMAVYVVKDPTGTTYSSDDYAKSIGQYAVNPYAGIGKCKVNSSNEKINGQKFFTSTVECIISQQGESYTWYQKWYATNAAGNSYMLFEYALGTENVFNGKIGEIVKTVKIANTDSTKVEKISQPVNPTTEYKTAYENLQHDLEPKVPSPIKNDLNKTPKPITIAEPKTITQVFGLQKAKNPEQFAKSVGLDYKNGQTRIVLTVNGTKDAISSLGKIGKVEASSSNLVQMTIDVKKINELYKLPYVKKVLIPSDAIQNGIVSEGVGFVHADKIQKKGIGGKGIKIAVLDLGFDVKSSEINKVVESKSFRYDFDNKLVPMNGFGTESIHGTAVAEIISDTAPKSELYLYTFSTEAEFLQAMDYAISTKVNIISMSAGWVNYPTDNTSPMTKKVEEAIKKGITFVVSSGNYAETHWEGKFIDSDADGWHEFTGTDEGLSFHVTQTRVTNKIPIVAYVMWSGKNSVDLNLVITDPNGKVVASSSNVQKVKGDEFEYIYYIPQNAVTYNLGITSGSSNPNVTLEVFAQNDIMEYSMAKGSVSVPTDAKGIISVGAINFANAKLEPFSSQGPTNNNKTSPTVVGPDAVKTQAYGKNPFYGTSAAQPHVAGIVALMLEKDPTLTPTKIMDLLQINTDKKILSKGDSKNSFGYGKVTADFVEKISNVIKK